MKAIECTGLHAAYDKRLLNTDAEVLKGIDFSLEEGKSLAILGNNGSGKSTLLRSLLRMLPISGRVCLLEKDVSLMKRQEIAACASYMTQINQIFFSYSVFETVLMGRYLHVKKAGRYTDEDRYAAKEAMKRTDVSKLSERQLSQLSGGELQRVFLARTFAQNSPILILDEPTNHLDLKAVAGISGYLREWKEEPHHTLAGVYHDIPLAVSLADELLLMKDGHIMAFGSKSDILTGGLLEEVYEFDVRNYLRSICI